MPRISVLLPVRDEERLLPAALASLQRQSLKDWELVAVDDGSRDSTPRILQRAARLDPRIRVLRRPAEGLVPALNAGLAACGSALVARMDGDDISHPQRLQKQVELLEERPEIDLVACGVRHFPRPLLPPGMRAYEAWQNSLREEAEIRRDLFVESPFAHPAVAFRRDRVLALGGYRQMGWAEDYDLWLRLAADGARFAKNPETLLFWRDRPQRLTRISPHCSAEAFRACKLHHLRRGFLRGASEVTLWGAGSEGKAWRRTLATAGIAVRRWIDIAPGRIGQRIHGAPVVHPGQVAPDQGKILITVGTRGARNEVRKRATDVKLSECVDFLCVT
ncbi:glycosyl transferase [Desulfuromonas versatilis]|uniref:Glycosyl transferase n=1 Tax=Desulfuromonas versatilis TaxID=2802975 RepID=A0ABM8HUB8_9BACT|nr:glycosyltransferase [Desulfuromonas versatilis]BCR05523.1 glycosyl transferase [Desulfuromonas versatilis]